MEDFQSIAASIFTHHGIDFGTVRRAGGWTNAVWLADGLVLRLSTDKENDGLLREARLADLFPPAVGYPTLVEAGTTEGFAWTLATRLPGRSLGEVWAELRWEERVTAMRDLWKRAQAVHSVPTASASTIAPTRAWFNSTNAEEAKISLARLTNEGVLTVTESRVLRDALERFWNAL